MSKKERVIILVSLFAVAALCGVAIAGSQPVQSRERVFSAASIVVNGASVDLFAQIPAEYIEAAASMRMVFFDKSVGANVSSGLDCLAGTGPASCGISAPQPYSRANWAYQWFAESGCGGWADIVPCFIAQSASMMSGHDVLMFGFSYMETPQAGALGYFNDTPAPNEIGDHTQYVMNAGKPVVHWTSSLTNEPTEQMTQWNETMRSYAASRGHALFDLADILSTRADGSRCYSSTGQPAICYPEWTSQTQPNAGHLNKAGQIRAAKALWVLMAQMAGWGADQPDPTPTFQIISPTDSPLPTPTPCDCPPCCMTTTPEPPVTEIPPAPTPSPAPTLPPQPTVTPAPTMTPTPESLCPMTPAMAEYTADLYDAALLFRNHIWPAFNDYGMVSRDQVIAMRNACRDRARGHE